MQADADAAGHLFRGCVFFLGRETPRDALSFLIRACGGAVAWDGPGSAHAESDAAITHQVVDRPSPAAARVAGREYVQPQWLFDSLNFRIRCPTAPYAPGVVPPPHLSPFVAGASGATDTYAPDFADTVRASRANPARNKHCSRAARFLAALRRWLSGRLQLLPRMALLDRRTRVPPPRTQARRMVLLPLPPVRTRPRTRKSWPLSWPACRTPLRIHAPVARKLRLAWLLLLLPASRLRRLAARRRRRRCHTCCCRASARSCTQPCR